jgi:leucyl-tRNA synthetase
VHPLTGAAVPVWIANYVLMEYGTAPSWPPDTTSDFEFAKKYGLGSSR